MLYRIKEDDRLVYESNTGILYYKFEEAVTDPSNEMRCSHDKDSEHNQKVGYMCPYIGPHGKFCRYDYGRIEEIY